MIILTGKLRLNECLCCNPVMIAFYTSQGFRLAFVQRHIYPPKLVFLFFISHRLNCFSLEFGSIGNNFSTLPLR